MSLGAISGSASSAPAGLPPGVTPVQVTRFHRDLRYQILPAYSQDSIVLSWAFRGLTDSAVFEDFIEQFLYHRNPFPQPRFVIIMVDASFHHIERCDVSRDSGISRPFRYNPG
jgi:hypothetical protein